MNPIQDRMSWHEDKVEELDYSVREDTKLNKTSHTHTIFKNWVIP